MENEYKNKKPTTVNTEKYNIKSYRKDAPGAIPGINTPGIELPTANPSVPNRAWTALRNGMDIDGLTDEERREMYYGKDIII